MPKRALVNQPDVEAPFSIGCFEFSGTGVQVHGRPTFHETQSAFDFVTRSIRCSGFWMVDLIKYIESRDDFGDRRDELISAETGMAESTVSVYRSIGKSVPPENRVAGVPFGHHMAVASLEPEEQTEWLEKSKAEGWTQTELKGEIRSSKRLKLLKGSAPSVQQLEIVLHVSVETPSYTKAAVLAKTEIARLLKNAPGGLILEAKVASVKERK